MREIKFKAWDKEYRRLLSVESLQAGGEHQGKYDDLMLGHDIPTWIFSKRYKFELFQYTGLKDKNGVEIYEGDILEGHWIEIYKRRGAVTFGQFISYPDRLYCYYFKVLDPDDNYFSKKYEYLTEENQDNFIVLGHIKTHPELLEGG